MLRYSLGMTEEATSVEKAVESVLNNGSRTPDIISDGGEKTSTTDMGDKIAQAIG